MKTNTNQNYWRTIKEIFTCPYAIRVESHKEWLTLSFLLCALFCTPASLALGITYLFAPLPDSIWLFMLIPWMVVGPFIPLCVYLAYYRAPRKSDEMVCRLLERVVPADSIVLESKNNYLFTKDGAAFRVTFGNAYFLQGRRRRRKAKIVSPAILLDFSTDVRDEQIKILEDIYAYLEDKPIGRIVLYHSHLLRIAMECRVVSSLDMETIVNELLYVARRFRMKPMTHESHREKVAEEQAEGAS